MSKRALILVFAGVLVGCAKPATPEPDLGVVPHPATLAEVVTPLEAAIGTGPERHVLARAEDVLLRACMRGLGLDWPVEPERTLRVTLQAWDLGYLDAETVPKFGYHPPGLQADLDVSVGGPAGGARIISGMQKAAYTGTGDPNLAGKPVPDGGCEGEARRRLAKGAPSVDHGMAINLANQTGEQSAADSRVAAVTGEWSQCMRGKGFDYGSPYDARDDARWGAEPPGHEEIRTAVADLECRRQTNYLGMRLAAISAYQRRVIDAQPSVFAQLTTSHQIQLRNAASILS